MPSTPILIPESARAMFQDGFERQAQQLVSRFREYAVVKEGCTGRSQAHRKLVKREMTDVTGRLQPTTGDEQQIIHRHVFPRKASLTTILDEDDATELESGVAPTGEIMLEHNSAAARKVDDIFLDGIMGRNWEGKESSLEPADIAHRVLIGFNTDGSEENSGLSLAKLIKGKSFFGKNEVYGQEQKDLGGKLCMAVSQDELDDLLYDAEYTGSADYAKVKALVDGEVDYFMGIHFLRTERIKTTSLGGGKIQRNCPIWVSTGVCLDFWYDVKTNIDVLPGLSQAVQIYSRLKAGACRKDEDRVVLVECEQDA